MFIIIVTVLLPAIVSIQHMANSFFFTGVENTLFFYHVWHFDGTLLLRTWCMYSRLTWLILKFPINSCYESFQQCTLQEQPHKRIKKNIVQHPTAADSSAFMQSVWIYTVCGVEIVCKISYDERCDKVWNFTSSCQQSSSPIKDGTSPDLHIYTAFRATHCTCVTIYSKRHH